MTENNLNEETFHRLFEQANQHVETRLKYLKLETTEKMSAFAANLVGGATVFVFALLVLFFFSMGFAWWIGDVLGHRAGGFFLSGLLFVPIGYVLYRWIVPFVRSKVIEGMMHETENLQTKQHEKS